MNSSEIEIDDPVVAINIHQQFHHAHNAEELYNAARGIWRMNRRRAERAKYLFAVFKGEIKEVYEIHQVIPATNETKSYWRNKEHLQGRKPGLHDGRSEFIGQLAADSVRTKYVGRRVPVRLTQNPVRYFNC